MTSTLAVASSMGAAMRTASTNVQKVCDSYKPDGADLWDHAYDRHIAGQVDREQKAEYGRTKQWGCGLSPEEQDVFLPKRVPTDKTRPLSDYTKLSCKIAKIEQTLETEKDPLLRTNGDNLDIIMDVKDAYIVDVKAVC